MQNWILLVIYCIIKAAWQWFGCIRPCQCCVFMIVLDLTLLIFNQTFLLKFPVLFPFAVTVLNLRNYYTWLRFAVDLSFHNQTTAAINLSLFFLFGADSMAALLSPSHTLVAAVVMLFMLNCDLRKCCTQRISSVWSCLSGHLLGILLHNKYLKPKDLNGWR